MKYIFILFIIAFLSYSCECTDVVPTEEPYRNTFFVQGISGNIIADSLSCSTVLNMNIIFNKPINGSTITFDENAFLTGYEFGNFSSSVNGENLNIVIEDFACSVEFCELSLNMSSGEAKGVRSQAGDILDGNRDGIAGDDFEAVITLYQ